MTPTQITVIDHKHNPNIHLAVDQGTHKSVVAAAAWRVVLLRCS